MKVLFKCGEATQAKHYCAICVMPLLYKLPAVMLKKRLRPALESELGAEQNGLSQNNSATWITSKHSSRSKRKSMNVRIPCGLSSTTRKPLTALSTMPFGLPSPSREYQMATLSSCDACMQTNGDESQPTPCSADVSRLDVALSGMAFGSAWL